jgi:two-component system OmpR family sensor kinase
VRSFRVTLALRFVGSMTLAVAALSALSVWIFRRALDEELNASLVAVASIQAASVTDSPGGGMEFHEWELTPDEASSVRDLVRYAQVWSAEGRSLLRSQYMTSDLPVDAEALAEAARGELVWGEGRYDATPVRVLYYPLSRFGQAHEGHVLEVAAPLVARDALVRRLVYSSMLVTALVALVSLLGSWWLAGRVVRPVYEVIDQAEGLGARSLDNRISAYADTVEYRRLVDVLNTMLDRIENAFEAQRRFTADASHELRSPLTVLRGELELALRRERSPEEYREVLESGVEEVRRLSQITENLLTLARSDAGALAPNPGPVDATEVVARIVDRLRPVARAREVTVCVEGEPLTLEIDRGLLGQVTWNLVENAIRFSPPGGTVEIGLEADAVAGGAGVRLTVRDRGPGPGAEPEALFRRFFREDPARARGNAGLGLAIVRAIAEAHGGDVGVRARAGGGTEIWARLAEMKAP